MTVISAPSPDGSAWIVPGVRTLSLTVFFPSLRLEPTKRKRNPGDGNGNKITALLLKQKRLDVEGENEGYGDNGFLMPATRVRPPPATSNRDPHRRVLWVPLIGWGSPLSMPSALRVFIKNRFWDLSKLFSPLLRQLCGFSFLAC